MTIKGLPVFRLVLVPDRPMSDVAAAAAATRLAPDHRPEKTTNTKKEPVDENIGRHGGMGALR